jgi:nucleoside-diphosphate-sugar epimerase
MTVIAVTGGSGFVGKALIENLARAHRDVISLPRTMSADGVPAWSLNRRVDVLIHAAARVHVMNETLVDPLVAFRQVNVQGTIALAARAAESGVRRFVFISSVKVNGEATGAKSFSCFDKPAPLDPYGLSKLEAEQALLTLSRKTGLEVVIVRPPLIYGPGIRANFLKLMKLVKSGVPLPLGAIENQRSMVAIDNLVDLLVLCADHSSAPGQTFMVSDDHDLSTSELLIMLANAMNKSSVLFPLPPPVIKYCASLLGQRAAANRLLDSLRVDIRHTKITLGWTPRVSVAEALRTTAVHYLKHS